MSGFRWGEPYHNRAGTAAHDAEKLVEACRGLGLRMLVLVRRQCFRLGLLHRKPRRPTGSQSE